ncbi:hypothetical protein F5Y03DRAFT_44418 [Xylaria venustula]|nr:hypothetical protein F5Y03DRAFT_44418 [Xylaria venustula]
MLSNLPTEILSLIFKNFCLHCRELDADGVPEVYYLGKQQKRFEPSWYSLDLQALYSTCLVSRRLCDIAQPILYHEFVPGYADSRTSARYKWNGRLTAKIDYIDNINSKRIATLIAPVETTTPG